MASKPPTAILPPPLSLAHSLLSSTLSLPPQPCIAHIYFSPSTPTRSDALENARRQLVTRNKDRTVLESFLPHVDVEKGVLVVFKITQKEDISLRQLVFEGLNVTSESSFTPTDLYPCSPQCADLPSPCSSCSFPFNSSNPSSSDQYLSPVPASLPRKSLRSVYSHFLSALLTRLIDDITSSALPNGRFIRRFKDGFLLGPPRAHFDWGVDWEHYGYARPLLACTLSIHLTPTSPSHIIIHPMIHPTTLTPLSAHLPLAQGTPITLLPYDTPASYLATYTGPVTALTALFTNALAGLGVGDWAADQLRTENSAYGSANSSAHMSTNAGKCGATYIIAWLAVENKQGEAKGMTLIWPTSLCLSYLPSPAHHAREPLAYIPALPHQLMPSPPPPPPPAIAILTSPTAPSSPAEYMRSSSTISAQSPSESHPQTPTTPSHPLTPVKRPTRLPPLSRTHSSGLHTPTYLRAFRALTVNASRGLDEIAGEVGGYVEGVAKERERERERMRKNRETSSQNIGGGPNTSSSASAIVQGQPVPGQFESPRGVGTPGTAASATPGIVQSDMDTPGMHATPHTAPLSMHFSADVMTPTHQPYPSPPQTNNSAHPNTDPRAHEQLPSSFAAPQSTARSAPTTANGPPSSQTQTQAQPDAFTNDFTSIQYDPFDDAWQNDDYMGMTMDMDMADYGTFGMAMGGSDFSGVTSNAVGSMNSIGSMGSMGGITSMGGMSTMGNGARGEGRTASFDDDFTFTDDDFSFFDRPSGAGAGNGTGNGGAGVAQMGATSTITMTGLKVNDTNRKSKATTTTNTGLRTTVGTMGMVGIMPSVGPAFGISLSSHPFVEGVTVDVNVSASGPGPPHTPIARHNSWNNTTPSIPGTIGTTVTSRDDSFSPRFSDMFTPAPDLVSSSPGKSPSSQTGPATPGAVQVGVAGTSVGISVFDPIPFASSHRIADGKYTVGKFALPSPSDEEDMTVDVLGMGGVGVGKGVCGGTATSTSTATGKGTVLPSPVRLHDWKLRYDAATDPRIGVVRKLIGVKRKIPSFTREYRLFSAWKREHEDWVSRDAPSPAADAEDGESDVESDEDDDVEIDDVQQQPASRTSTPPPAYLPLGPTLLGTCFRHKLLLPLCVPLCPPTLQPNTQGPSSVPTPVSPAAAGSSEKSRFLEAAGYMVASEMVENSVWADAWRAGFLGSSGAKGYGDGREGEVWQEDVRVLVRLLCGVKGFEGPLDLQSLFGNKHVQFNQNEEVVLQKLEPPMFSVCKGDAVIQVLPSAIRFWEKLGLGPLGGKKDVTAYVLFDEEGLEKQLQAEGWLASISAMYTAKQLGKHVSGTGSGCPKGAMPFRFDTFRKSLATFVASLPAPQSNLVFYVVTPDQAMSLASPLLRQLFSAVKRAQKTYSEAQILFHFIPEQLIRSVGNSANTDCEIQTLCYSVYRRVSEPVDRYMSRRFSDHGERRMNYFQEQPFTIARPITQQVTFSRQTLARSLDVIDRHTLLHVGYQISSCCKWLLAACVDQRGEAHNLGVWLVQGDWELFVVEQIWKFTLAVASKANIEWRIAVAKLGTMSVAELDAWTSHLASAVPVCTELPPFHVSLYAVDQGMPWTFISPKNDANLSTARPGKDAKPVYLDASATTYILYTPSRMPLNPLPSSAPRDTANTSLIPDTEEMPPQDTLGLLPISTTMLIRAPAGVGHTAITMNQIHLLHSTKSPDSSLTIPDRETHKEITRNYYELSVLADSMRHMGLRANPILPFHLAALETMHDALTQRDMQ